jgi:hypothetical protein
MLELIEGPASAGEGADTGFFDGTVSPKNYTISEALAERADLFLEKARAGRLGRTEIKEAFSTSDFTLALFASIETETLAQYQELQSVWRQYTDVTTVGDFRPKRLIEKWFKQIGLALVPELTEYPGSISGDRLQYWISVAKYGLRDAISWEAYLNNEAIDELESIPTKYASAAIETETINALANYFAITAATNTANGPNLQFWKNYTTGPFAGVNNTPDNKPLTAQNIDLALQAMSTRKNPKSGRQIASPDLIIVIPKSLEWSMQKIQALREIRITVGDTESVYDNFLKASDYVVDPMLDSINVGANAATNWMIVPKPGSRRPASFAAFLRGHESPDLRVKADTGRRIGGGEVSPIEGSFDIDDIQYRVRHVVGHQTGDPTFTYFSNGA